MCLGSFFFAGVFSGFGTVGLGAGAGANQRPPATLMGASFPRNRGVCFETRARGAGFAGSSLGASLAGRIIGLASLQCVPGGIGSTRRSSRITPPAVWLGNQ